MSQLYPIFTVILQTRAEVWSREEIVSAVIGPITGLTIAFLVYHLVRRIPWPRPFSLRFAALHVVAAPAAAGAWAVLTTALIAAVAGGSFVERLGDRWEEMLVIGVFFYVIVAGVSYAIDATARAAHAEALAARTQLAALRSQIQPHFLFNALHTVVQLIPVDPARATQAAELVAGLLRATMEDDRDIISLGDEWAFVSRYLELERIRFGDRLRVRAAVDPDLLDVRVPSFTLQTLVENAVRHGAAPRIEPTDIVVTATGTPSDLTLSVRNNGNGPPMNGVEASTGTGLNRLRERLFALHGSAARLTFGARENGDFEAVVVVPRERAGV